jgi:hypothetical protein
MLKKLEMEYFNSLSNVKLNIVGPERVGESPLLQGVTAVGHTKDLYFFAVASLSGYITIVSSKDLAVKGIAFVNCPVLELSF